MTKQEKLELLKRSFERQGNIKADGETDLQFVKRIVDDHLAQAKERFLRQNIQVQLSIETPQEPIDVSDLE